jgi:hypothetical protein
MKYIGVIGNKLKLPIEFPLTMPENSGNMVHANAPFKMFNNCVFAKEDYHLFGEKSHIAFINKKCSHLIMTLANSLRHKEGDKYTRMTNLLEKIEIPIVPFGLGAQAENMDINKVSIPQEAVNWLQCLGSKCASISVRGKFTKSVIEKYSGVSNIRVTGCPSFFTNPHVFNVLRNKKEGKPAYSGTRFTNPLERSMFQNAVAGDTFFIEPVSKINHRYFLNVCNHGVDNAEIPYFFKPIIEDGKGNIKIKEFAAYFQKNYKLFRSIDEWFNFNHELVSFTYGTRFHVNMASLLSGCPALWITHDSRTKELVDTLHLPSIALEQAAEMNIKELHSLIDYSKLFDNLSVLFENFNIFLDENNLPKIEFQF